MHSARHHRHHHRVDDDDEDDDDDGEEGDEDDDDDEGGRVLHLPGARPRPGPASARQARGPDEAGLFRRGGQAREPARRSTYR